MSGERRFGGLLGAVTERLRARKRAEADRSAEPSSAESEPSTAERLDDALAELRKRVPEPEQERSEPPASSD